jgi:hypothetical protein
MLNDTTKRIGAVLGSVVTLVTGLAAIVTVFIAEVAPQLPNGWQDDAFRWGGIITTVLLSAAAGLRRVTEVPAEARGLVLPPGQTLEVTASDPRGSSTITSTA